MQLLELFGEIFKSAPRDTLPPRPEAIVSPSWLQVPTIASELECEVVVQESRRKALQAAYGGDPRTPGSRSLLVLAELVPEPGKRVDTKNIRVDVGGMTVGFIAPADVPEYNQLIKDLWSRGKPASCHARLKAGWNRRQVSDDLLGICLLAGNPPRPSSPETPFLPPGDEVAVTGVQDCQPFLEGVLGSEKHRSVTARLQRPDQDDTGDGPPVACVSVWIRDQRVGFLTPYTTERYTGVFDCVSASGLSLTCHAIARRSKQWISVYIKVPQPWRADSPVWDGPSSFAARHMKPRSRR